MGEIPDLPPRRTLNGKFDAYCHVCWNAIYVLWVDDETPFHDRCPHGAASALTCPDAIAAAKTQSVLADLRRRGLIGAPSLRENTE